MNIGGQELMIYIKSISQEKDLPFQQVLEIFADSLAQSAKRSSAEAMDGDFRVSIDPQSGDMTAFRRWRVLADDELMENNQSEMMLEDAQIVRADAQPGEYVEKPFDTALLNGRSCVHSAKNNFNYRLRDADRRRLVDELLARDEELVSGQITRVSRETGDAIVEVMRMECRLPKNQMIPREALKAGDRVQAAIRDFKAIKEDPEWDKSAPVILTRVSADFIKHLFRRVVPEIEKGILEIINAVRDPGNRAKISVRTNDQRVDPVGTCVGIRGSRVQAVTNELSGERVDIIPWNDDPARFVLQALSPAEIQRISIDKPGEMNVLVDPERMAQAIGKNGVNVRLASDLTGWKLNLRTVADYEAEEQESLKQKSADFAQTLNLEEDVARILLEEGFDTLEHVAYGDENELLEIAGFQPDAVHEIQRRAREQVEKEDAIVSEKMAKQDGALAEFLAEDESLRRSLARADILTLRDLADLAADELAEISDLDENAAGECIMSARALADGEGESKSESGGEAA